MSLFFWPFLLFRLYICLSLTLFPNLDCRNGRFSICCFALSLSSYCVFLLALAIVFQSVVRVCDLFVMHSYRIVVLASILVYCLIVPSSAQLYLVCLAAPLAAFWSKLLSDVSTRLSAYVTPRDL